MGKKPEVRQNFTRTFSFSGILERTSEAIAEAIALSGPQRHPVLSPACSGEAGYGSIAERVG